MERTKRNGALAVLVLLLIFLSIYLAILNDIEPERRQTMYGFVDESDGLIFRMSFSDMWARFNETEFQNRYYVNNSADAGELAILPKHNPDVEIYLLNDSWNGLHFYILGYEDIGGLYYDPDDILQDMEDEITWVLAYIDHEDMMRDYSIDDNDFATIDVFFQMILLFALLAVIVLYAFAMLYQNGWLIDNFHIVDTHIEFYVGLGFMYPTAGFALLALWGLVRGTIVPEGMVCLALDILVLLVGFYVVANAVRRYSQSYIEHPSVLYG